MSNLTLNQNQNNDQRVNYELIGAANLTPIKAWIKGVPLDNGARQQLLNLATMPFIYSHIAVMPDAHEGRGSTIGSVIPTLGAIIPAGVGVDLGCGMMAVRTTLKSSDLPDNLRPLRNAIEKAVPVGFGKWNNLTKADPAYEAVTRAWTLLVPGWEKIIERHPDVDNGHVNHHCHLGTLGTGNHFIEVCVDESDAVWLMLHSGSRGVGNRIGTYFIELAQEDMRKHMVNLPDKDLAYLEEGSDHFTEYLEAVTWAQEFALMNRVIMMEQVEQALSSLRGLPSFSRSLESINCHHNYVARETHFDTSVWVTRKGAVRAQTGDMGIIPGSMGVGSYIVRGKGNPDSFNSCSHGAGRTMSRTQAKKKISLEQHLADTKGVECRKDADIIDESPRAYKSLDDVMNAQSDLIDIQHRLKTLVCVKG